MDSSLVKCLKCDNDLDKTMFSKDSTRKTGHHPYCRICRNKLHEFRRKKIMEENGERQEKIRAYDRKRYANGKKKQTKEQIRKASRNFSLKFYYGITHEEYLEIYENQKGLCAICEKPETRKEKTTGKTKWLSVDHCHDTGRIRGLLCSKCNNAIGLLGDNYEGVKKALDYLQEKEVCYRFRNI